MAEFVLEVRSEEIPARMVAAAAKKLAGGFFENLVTRGLPPEGVESHYTVRRLIVRLTGLAEREKDRQEEELGPPVNIAWDENGAATKALIGFAQRCGVALEEVSRQQTRKGEYAVVHTVKQGQPMLEILAELAPKLITGLEWGKPMRWGDSIGPWVRPIRGIVAVLDGQTVPFEVFGIPASDQTIGHPILSPEEIMVANWSTYTEALAARGIVIDGDQRESTLREGFAAAADELGGAVPEDSALLSRLAAMVEIPGIVVGKCDPEGLPGEVLTASLRDHQNAFGVTGEGQPLPAFLTVMDRADDPEGLVRQGNEWVVAARLEDARFFVAEDRRKSLNDRKGDLEQLTFHRRLGSYADKTERLLDFGCWLCALAERSDLIPLMQEAASLAKVDLTCEVVKEFTDLQGVMGGVYASEQGHPDEVAAAIYQQYQPTASADPIPGTDLARLLSIADRMVTLGGFFALGEIPSGSRDPYALRRAAQGVVEILIGAGLELDLGVLSGKAIELHADEVGGTVEEASKQLSSFLADRLRSLLGRRGFAYDEVAAAVAVDALPVAAMARVEALHDARKGGDFIDVADAAKRIRNILTGQAPASSVDMKRFAQDEERELWHALAASRDVVADASERHDYPAAIEHIAGYAPILGRFFDEVLVMADDAELRANRLALLAGVDDLFSRIGDLSQLAVERRGTESTAEGPG